MEFNNKRVLFKKKICYREYLISKLKSANNKSKVKQSRLTYK